jgi:hypothetical protein
VENKKSRCQFLERKRVENPVRENKKLRPLPRKEENWGILSRKGEKEEFLS